MNYNEEFRNRTKKMVLDTLELFRSLPKTEEARIIGKQLLRSACSVGANYRASGRTGSDAERFAKLSIVVEEADETAFWLEILTEGNIIPQERTETLRNEVYEIVKVMSAYRAKLKHK